jgi:hypothetical protein
MSNPLDSLPPDQRAEVLRRLEMVNTMNSLSGPKIHAARAVADEYGVTARFVNDLRLRHEKEGLPGLIRNVANTFACRKKEL